MLTHADMRIVSSRGGRRKQDEPRFDSGSFMRAANEFAADALPLIGYVNGEIRKVSGIVVIGDRSRYANKQI